MFKKKRKFFQLILIAIMLAIFGLPDFVFSADGSLEESCQIESIESSCKVLSTTDCRILLEKCDLYFQEKSSELEKDISKTQAEKDTLKNKISILNNKIKQLDYQIYQNNLMIKDLGFQIGDTEDSIDKTSLKIEESKNKLSKILREIYEQDQRSTVEILIIEGKFSDFFDNLAALESLNAKNQELLKSIKELKISLENQKQSLDEEKGELESAVKIQTLQKQESDTTKKNQEYYLKLTETEYQRQLSEKKEIEKIATEIRSRIFELVGVPEAPTFGEALELAKYVEKVTGVRPAFLLAILTQESNIGKNVGQCFLRDTSTGSGVNSKGQTITKIMKPSRDVQPFLTITGELGRDPFNTPVSCPIPSVGGYGGAMGPAQFIPSTWVIYKDQVKNITGEAADPWDIKDAFLAAALYVKKYGAASQTYNDEWKAAMIYFSGTTNAKYRFYGDSVMALAKKYEADIKVLESQ